MTTAQATTIRTAAARHNITRQRMLALVKQGRVPGARLEGGVWLLPDPFTITPPSKRKRKPEKITTS